MHQVRSAVIRLYHAALASILAVKWLVRIGEGLSTTLIGRLFSRMVSSTFNSSSSYTHERTSVAYLSPISA